MKIKGPSKVGSVKNVRKKTSKKIDPSAFSDSLNIDETSSINTLSGTSPLTAMNNLLGLQEIPSSTEGKARNIMRANNLLEHLDHIQRGLLMGSISPKQLNAIATLIASKRIPSSDEKLNAIIDDIELRVKVEIAKLDY